ncbi:alpha/beta hydrolase [Actinocorallia sp. API 0066]|uniref:alpha/beta hydrolase family protein n=1 Tax=Actinocorallia sp. API 0066 TaxID=2896846 RepID=UPI001E59F239|nr:alpha/beta hydrolase [Actinocorallia sp. API 0066]MCD0449508.1 alpha/beta hydrolase [Actinocorallia sp. API 0066]
MRKPIRLIVAALALVAGVVAAPAAHAAPNPHQRGPEPTEASVTAERGPFAVASQRVTAFSHPGFKEGTVYYPTDTSQGTFGAVAISPGFVSPEATVAWYGPRLASQGFVVMTLETTTGADLPEARAGQLLAVLDYLTKSSPVKNRIDPSRLAVMGWSMGGGGTLRAAQLTPSLKAAIPLAPWDLGVDFSDVRVPTLVIGADNDFIAATGLHSEPFYESLTVEKAYLELENAGHFTFTTANPTIAKYSISWLKRWVDDDTRYDRFLCPPPAGNGPVIQEYRSTCPY